MIIKTLFDILTLLPFLIHYITVVCLSGITNFNEIKWLIKHLSFVMYITSILSSYI